MLLAKIKSDTEMMKQDLAHESRQARQTKTMSSNQGGRVSLLQQQADIYLRKIEAERRAIDDLERQLITQRKETIEQSAQMGGMNASKEQSEMINKQLRQLENRLDKVHTCVDEGVRACVRARCVGAGEAEVHMHRMRNPSGVSRD